MIRKLPILIVAMLLFSCSDDDDGIKVNLDDFEAITEDFPFNDLHPATNFDYFELIRAIVNSPEAPNNEYILSSSGELCSAETCKTNFEQMTADRGFGPDCLPGSCFNYIKAQKNDQFSIINSKEGLKDFLGTIDTAGDALLWVRTNGYYWDLSDIANGAIKETEDGFELIMLQTVKYCTPLQTNRFHLKIDYDGTISILAEEVAEFDKNACV